MQTHLDVANGVGASLAAVGALVFPLYAFLVLTALMIGVYAVFGLCRWTFVLAYPALLVSVPLLAYGLRRRTFVWGCCYRWQAKFDVEVIT